MKSLIDDLCTGLLQAIDHEQVIGKAKTRTLMIAPVKKYSNDEIKAIRNKAGMTQAVFANHMGVSRKTVEAWELGRTHPTGSAYRLLNILENGKSRNFHSFQLDSLLPIPV